MEPQKPTRKTTPAGRRALSGIQFLRYTLHRFAADQCTQRAAALTYTTLLALVPLVTISFAIFSAFAAFEGVREQVQAFIFENFVPQVGSAVQGHLEEFSRKTGRLTAVGVVFLVVTSVMLLSTISTTFNGIWRVRQTRNLLIRVPVYWFVLTAAPLLLGAGMSLSGVLFTMARETGVETYTGPLIDFAVLVPPILQIAGLTMLFLFVPNVPVRWRDALAGGITAGLLLEVLKQGFGLYVTYFPTYQTIYGALATFPIFLIWMYVLWMVVLFGAEIAAARPEWRAGVRHGDGAEQAPAAILTAAAAVLALLLAASRRGGGLSERLLARRSRQAPELVHRATQALQDKRYLARTEAGQWILGRDLDTVTLADLQTDLGLSVSLAAADAANQAWGERLATVLLDAESAARQAMTISLRDLLEVSDESGRKLAGADDEDEDDDDEVDENEDADYKSKLLAWLGLAWLGTR